MKIALAQIDPTVGDFAGNVSLIEGAIARAKEMGSGLVLFPELTLCGYPPKDLLLRPAFLVEMERALERVAAACVGVGAIVGFADKNPSGMGRPLRNGVAFCAGGKVVSRHYKRLLPTYDVFDESRYFEPGKVEGAGAAAENIVEMGGIRLGLSVCEDLWNDVELMERRLYADNPIEELVAVGAEVIVNCSASPFVADKHAFRLKLFGGQAKRFGVPVVYVNEVGGNDELVFDGASVVFSADGAVVAQARDFEPDLMVVELTRAGGKLVCRAADKVQREPVRGGLASIHGALVLGLADYVKKCGFKSVVLGLSGGIDSALTAALAVEALGADKVVGVAMPSRFSSEHSLADAKLLAKNLGIEFHIVPIGAMHDAYEATLAGSFAGREKDATEENIQARVRGGVLMAFSNKFGHLLLTTGNKSEIAVGYCTLYGDMCGGLAVISDVPKTVVWDLSRFINQKAGREVIPRSSIEKVPSAELRPNQTDQDSLPPYDVLDDILNRFVEREQSVAEIIAAGHGAAVVQKVLKLIDRSEYKRRQAAPGIKVTSRAFGFGRRMPVAQNFISW